MNWLKARRERVGIESQEEFAALLQLEGFSITRAAISHWENGTRQPPFNNPMFRKALAKILRMSEPKLLRFAGYEVEDSIHTEEAERGAEIIDQLEPGKRELALRLLEQLLA